MVTLLPADAGGRAAPAYSGYRSHHRLLGDYETSGVHDYVGRQALNPGETAETAISFLEPLAYLRSISKGDVIEISEGARVVGHATILAVLNPVLQRVE
jgi:translation elongation factor EF-Tu-like GTPase